jgi:hypothetical protein
VYLVVLVISFGIALLALPFILIHFNHQKREVKVWAREVEPGIVEITVKGSDDWERAALSYLRQNFREAGDASLVLGEDSSPASAAGYCSKCGTQVREGDLFCSSCGTRLQTL